jgi:glucose-6-phosphate 1-dehydrogenase
MKSAAPVIVIFGITGDLSKRKLLPALYHLFSQDVLPEDTKIVGISRHELTVDSLLNTVELCVLEKDNVCGPAGLARVRATLHTHQLNPEQPDDFRALQQLLDSFDKHARRDRLLYMAIPAAAYAPIVQQLAAIGLNDERSRLLLEKPFGYSLESARQLVELVDQAFAERQIYRIDHYLAKETAQNLLTFRLHNPIFTPLWNSEHIKRVHIRATETIGVEGRANFYEQTGALRDFVQSHLMQLLGITLMELPTDMGSEAIRASKQQFFEQLLPADPAQAVRGQYDGYRQEVNNPHSVVETYVRLQLQHATERWQDTDIILETGKGLASKTTDITLEFKTPHERRRNNLTFQIQPDEGISLDLVVKAPGFENHMHHAALDFRYQHTFDEPHIDAYERVLMDAVRGDQSLFASDRDVLSTWRVLQPLLDAWLGSDQGLAIYPIGSEGPVSDT